MKSANLLLPKAMINEGVIFRFPRYLDSLQYATYWGKGEGVMGSKPIHVMSMEERAKVAKITDYFIDLGMKKDEVEKLVKPGDVVTRERSLIEMGDCINGKSIDNRIAVYILIETLRRLKDVPYVS